MIRDKARKHGFEAAKLYGSEMAERVAGGALKIHDG